MAKGDVFPAESSEATDPRTGVRVRQVTNHPSIHHHPFFIVPAYDDAMTHLFVVSHRAGAPRLYAENRAEGTLIELTDRPDLAEWSIHPSHDGRYVFFTAGAAGYRLDMTTLGEEELIRFPESQARPVGGVAGDMGTTALSPDDRWWAVHFSDQGIKALAIVDTGTGRSEVILRRDAIGHIQFCPDDAELIAYAGPHTERIWTIRRDGSQNRFLYPQGPMQWVTHETWIPGRRELAFVDWPHGVKAVAVDSGAVRSLASFNVWHVACDRSGRRMVADTHCPDIGIHLFDAREGNVPPRVLCYPEASNAGSHWAEPFPYAKGPVKVYAPQHTHPHPSFSPDARRIVFTSDRTGHAQVYEVILPDVCRVGGSP